MHVGMTALLLFSLADVPEGFTETLVASGLSRPVALAWLPGGRLLIGQQGSSNGTAAIRLFKNGALQSTPYATLTGVYRGHNESGLLGLAVDPNFAVNGYVYVFVTVSSNTQRVLRYHTVGDAGTNPTVIVNGIPTNGINHNGGGLCFGPDGKLYVAVGDGGSTPGSAPMTSNWRGKILRFNPDGTIPSDNPFGPGNAVYTVGHRHPFRIALRPGTSQLFAAENGTSVHDEINLLKAGMNYGWPSVEGPSSFGVSPTWSSGGAGVIAITDLLFYAGSALPFAGQLFFVGYSSDTIYRAKLSADGGSVISGPFAFVTGRDQPVDIEVGPDGAIYYCTLTGKIWKVQPVAGSNQAPAASFTVTPSSGTPPLSVSVDASASSDPDGSIVSYSWSWGDGSSPSSGVTSTHTYSASGSFTILLTVADNVGAVSTFPQVVVATTAGNAPPSAHIESTTPSTGVAPLAVSFQGHGHDASPAGDLLEHRWDFGDGSPYVTFSGVFPDANTTANHTYSSPGTYTCTLRVKDSQGITSVNSVSVTVTLGSSTTKAVRITISAVNVRSGPGTSYPIKGKAYLNQRYVSYASSNGWFRIWFDGTSGWVYGGYTQVVTGAPTIKVIANTAAVRNGAGTGFSVVGNVYYGQAYCPTPTGSTTGWHRIYWKGGMYYLPGSSVNAMAP